MSAGEVIVIGGGQAGLAAGRLLSRRGVPTTILEAATEPAAAWRSRWDSLRLFTPVRYDSLPDRPFPGDPESYPGRDDVVEYLAEYAREFELPVQLGSRVRSLREREGRFVVEAGDRELEADQVVVATGPFQVPRIPDIGAGLGPRVLQLHSGDYRAPHQIADGPVLVVGGGNSGFQIAAELAATHDVHLAIGSRQLSLPQRPLGRDLFRILEATGAMSATAESRIGRRMRDRDTLIGSSPRSARRRHGIQIRARATGASGSTVAFADGTTLEPGTVIWSTGFGMDHSWIDLPVFGEDGSLRHRRGVTPVAGLFFLGLPWQHTRGSALLGWVKEDAAHIADRIAAGPTTR